MSDLQELVRQCLIERQAFFQRGERASPACVALFRRAFARDELAWDAIFTQVFPHEIRRYIQAAAQCRKDQAFANFSPADLEDAVQETQFAFYHCAPEAPTLLDSGELAPIITYLKKCAMRGVATVARKLPRNEETLAAIAGEDDNDNTDANAPPGRKYAMPVAPAFTETIADVGAILDELNKILQTDLERLIAQECFLNATPPRELVADYAHRFPGVDPEAKLKYLNQALKRIRLRAEKSPSFQNLRNARRKNDGMAFLIDSGSDVSEVGKVIMPGIEPCAFDEATLLEYIQGNASAELRTAIDRSPACVEAARRFAEQVEILAPLFRLALCPDVETLIDYHAKALPSAKQLVVHKHLQHCRQCQAEIALFAAIDAVPLQAEPPFLRRLMDAVLAVPTLALSPIRGALLQYQTPTIHILLDTRKSTGKTRTWTLIGELRTHDGMRFTELESVSVQQNDAPGLPALPATLEEDGSFVLKGLAAGSYRVQIITSTEEIHIRELMIGDDG